MNIEHIELRKILSQMLADNEINRNTIIDFVKSIIDEKVENAISHQVSNINLTGMINNEVSKLIHSSIREEVARKVRTTLGCVSVSLTCSEPLIRKESK